MTQEEAIIILRDLHDSALFSVRNALETLVPELKDNDDEITRKELLEYHKEGLKSLELQERDDNAWLIEQERKFIDWLEKQKERPSERITDEEMKTSMDTVAKFKVFAADLAVIYNITHERDIDWHNFCVGLLTYLKRNKPEEWKPTREQMEALMLAIEGKCPPTSYMSRRLEDLYDGLANTFSVECDLKKFEEEHL